MRSFLLSLKHFIEFLLRFYPKKPNEQITKQRIEQATLTEALGGRTFVPKDNPKELLEDLETAERLYAQTHKPKPVLREEAEQIIRRYKP